MSAPASDFTPESRLRLTGGRYEAAGFPIDGLPELVQYERLVLDVAKALWLRDHSDRQRVPKGFAKVVGLRLTKVEEGSAIPVLIRPDVADTLPDVDPSSILDAAQDLVDQAFHEIVSNNRLPDGFPSGLAGHFLRLGRTLQGNEAIEFGAPASGSAARYTQPVRKRFLIANQNSDFPLDGVIVGRITALDTNALALTITDLAGRNIPGTYSDDALTPDLLEVFNRRDLAPVVRLDCTQLIGSDEAVSSIEEIRALEVFLSSEEVPGRDRLLELLQLEDGWLDGEGEVPDLLALEKARDILQLALESGLPEPGVFPRIDGSVQVQWITSSDVWTAHLVGDGPIEVDYLAVEIDEAAETEASSTADAVAFFVERFQQVNP